MLVHVPVFIRVYDFTNILWNDVVEMPDFAKAFLKKRAQQSWKIPCFQFSMFVTYIAKFDETWRMAWE